MDIDEIEEVGDFDPNEDYLSEDEEIASQVFLGNKGRKIFEKASNRNP